VIAVRRGSQWIEAQEQFIVMLGDELLAAGTPEAIGRLGRFEPARNVSG
jgi:uncharacterized protein with PhoU and TrkA domain